MATAMLGAPLPASTASAASAATRGCQWRNGAMASASMNRPTPNSWPSSGVVS